MRRLSGGVAHIASIIEEDLYGRETCLQKPHITGLADIAASVLTCSDFKTRGFGITKTQLKHVDRIERLILILTVALYWAISTGMQPDAKSPKSQKKDGARLRHSSKKEYVSS